MAVSVNVVIIAGNLARDPELKYTNSGKAVCNFTVAVNDYHAKEASFYRCTAWEKVAENINQYLSKGSPVLVEGHLHANTYEKNGDKRTSVEIVAKNVQFLSMGERSGDTQKEPAKKQECDYSRPNYGNVSDAEYKDTTNDEDIPF